MEKRRSKTRGAGQRGDVDEEIRVWKESTIGGKRSIDDRWRVGKEKIKTAVSHCRTRTAGDQRREKWSVMRVKTKTIR